MHNVFGFRSHNKMNSDNEPHKTRTKKRQQKILKNGSVGAVIAAAAAVASAAAAADVRWEVRIFNKNKQPNNEEFETSGNFRLILFKEKEKKSFYNIKNFVNKKYICKRFLDKQTEWKRVEKRNAIH